MKSREPAAIRIRPEIAAKVGESPGEFDRFDALFRSVITVPKKTIDKRERAWKRKQEKKRVAK